MTNHRTSTTKLNYNRKALASVVNYDRDFMIVSYAAN